MKKENLHQPFEISVKELEESPLKDNQVDGVGDGHDPDDRGGHRQNPQIPGSRRTEQCS